MKPAKIAPTLMVADNTAGRGLNVPIRQTLSVFWFGMGKCCEQGFGNIGGSKKPLPHLECGRSTFDQSGQFYAPRGVGAKRLHLPKHRAPQPTQKALLLQGNTYYTNIHRVVIHR